jgi:hypothetical protein
MKNTIKIYLLLTVGFLASCAHEPTLEQRLQSHYGHHIDELIVQFGPPSQTQDLSNDSKLYLWRSQGATHTVAEPIPFNFTGQKQLVTSTPVCETQYITDSSGIITSGSYRGQCR